MGMSRRSSRFFTSTRRLCCVKSCHSTFADTRHLRSLRTRFPDLYDFIQDPGHHQQPCVYIRLSPWHSPYYVGATDQDVLRREHSRSLKFLPLLRGRHAFFEPALHYWKRSNTYWLFCAIPVEIKLPISSVWVQEGKWQHLLRPHLNAPWVHRLLRKICFREHLVVFRRHSLSSPTSLGLHQRFRRRLHPDLQRQLRPEMLDDIQAHYSTGIQHRCVVPGYARLTVGGFSSYSALLLPTTLRLRQRAFSF